jgi:hypothetical protein
MWGNKSLLVIDHDYSARPSDLLVTSDVHPVRLVNGAPQNMKMVIFYRTSVALPAFFTPEGAIPSQGGVDL